MNTIEFDAVKNLPAVKRYEYFIKKVVDYEEVWGLYYEGWATTVDEAGNTLIPFWPKKEFAKFCAIDDWRKCIPKKIELMDFIEMWLPGMKKDQYLPSIFWNNKDSVVVDIDKLLEDLEIEGEKY